MTKENDCICHLSEPNVFSVCCPVHGYRFPKPEQSEHWYLKDNVQVSLKIGETITFLGRPPSTWWDRFLWRWFRIERKRKPILQSMKIIGQSSPSEITIEKDNNP